MLGFSAISEAPVSYVAPTAGGGTPAPDGVPPTFDGTLSYSKTSSSITVDWSATTSSDNVAVARREYRIGGSGPYTPASTAEETSKRHTFSGLAAATTYPVEVRCVDTSNNVSVALSISVTTSAAPAPGGNGVNYIRLSLVSRKLVPYQNLSTVEWSLFAQLSPANFGAPVAQGTHQMPAGSSQLEIAVNANAVPAGWYSFIMSDPDGTTTAVTRVLVA